MTTDREVLVVLVQAIEAGGPTFRPRGVSTALRAARLHLQATRDRPAGPDCSEEVERASRAAYAAGQARQAGATP